MTDLSGSVLKISLLGPPIVVWEGHPLLIQRRKVRALLYRLCGQMTKGGPVSREHLCLLFWPDMDEASARRNLSHLLTHLRLILPQPEALLVPDELVQLDTRLVSCDLIAFQDYQRQHLPEQAVELIRGDFLAGFYLPRCAEFEQWTNTERNAFERSHLDLLASLVEKNRLGEQYERAIQYAKRYLEVDDLSEEIHSRLMSLYALTGDRTAALHQFDICKKILKADLGVAPLPETITIYQSVLQGSLPPDKVSAPAWPRLQGLDLPLVGRKIPLERLSLYFNEHHTDHGKIIFLTGESGVGKTRLMRDFASSCQGKACILFGAGYPGEHVIPYQPIADTLRSSNLLQFKIDLKPVWLAEVSRLLPELRTVYPDLPLPMPSEPEAARSRLFEALVRYFHAQIAFHGRMLLCLDDLHWADQTTIDWLAYFGRSIANIQSGRVLVLATSSDDSLESIQNLRHSLQRLGVFHEIQLQGLEYASVEELLHLGHLNLPDDPKFIDRLHKATGGNPLFILEILRSALEQHNAVDLNINMNNLPLPSSVRSVIESRLQRLNPHSMQVLEAAAILAPLRTFDLIRLTAGRSEAETAEGLDELLARHVLIDRGSEYHFVHDLTRRVVESRLNHVRKQLLHRRAALAIQKTDPEAVSLLAYHFDAAGNPVQAVHYHALSAQRASALFAWQEAEYHQSRELALLELLDPHTQDLVYPSRRGELLAERAHLRFIQGRLQARDADLQAMSQLAETANDAPLKLQALIHRTRYMNLDGQYQQAISLSEEGSQLAAQLHETATQSRFLVHIGFAYYFLGQPCHSLSALETAASLLGESPSPESYGRLAHTLGYVHFHLGNYAASLDYQQQALNCHRTVGEFNRIAWDMLDIGSVYLQMGQFAEARRFMEDGLAQARRFGAQPAEAYGLYQLGYWELYQGAYQASVDLFHQALIIQESWPTQHLTLGIKIGLGQSHYHLGSLDTAREWLEDTVPQSRSLSLPRRLTDALLCLGLVESAAGHLALAQQYAREAVIVARACEYLDGLTRSLAAQAQTGRLIGDYSQALPAAREALQLALSLRLPTYEMWAQFEIGLILLSNGDTTRAREHLGRAISLAPGANQAWIRPDEVRQASSSAFLRL